MERQRNRIRPEWLRFVAVLLALGFPQELPAQNEPIVRIVSIEGHRKRFDLPAQNAILRYLLIDVTSNDWNGDGSPDSIPLRPTGIVVLFSGGTGRLNLNPQGRELGSPSFPISRRYQLASEGFIVAAVDAATDFLAHNHRFESAWGIGHGSGLSGHQLPGRLYADSFRQDLEAVIGDLRTRFPGLPLFALGLSSGTLSAFVAATELSRPPDGIVLASPPSAGTSAAGDLGPQNPGLKKVTTPVLIVSHKDDRCLQTRAEDAARLATRLSASKAVEHLVLTGGYPGFGSGVAAPGASGSLGCEGLDAHNLFGVEDEAVRAIASWMRKAAAASATR